MKQQGWSEESNLLYKILKAVQRLVINISTKLPIVNTITSNKQVYGKNEDGTQDMFDIIQTISGASSEEIPSEAAVAASLVTKQNLPTGFITGLQLSINADNTKIDIATGAYAISDFTDLNNIQVVIKVIDTPIIGITPNYLHTNNITYFAIDINKNIIQSSTPFTNEQRRTLAILGAAIHSNLINVNVTNEIKAPIVAPTNQLHDLIRAIGSFNLEGNIYSSNGANLQLNKTAGVVFGLGINAQNYLNPHELSIPNQTGLTFRYRLQSGFEYSDRTTIDPANYDNAGVLTPLLNNNKWQVQRINLFQSGLTRIQPGQHQYDSLADAEASIKTETFVTEANIAQNAIFRSYLIVKKNTTNLNDVTQAKFIPVDKFGNVITGNTALTATNIIAALGFTPENTANKVTTMTGNTASNTLFLTAKAIYDWATSLFTPLTRTITINGETHDLSANRTYTVSTTKKNIRMFFNSWNLTNANTWRGWSRNTSNLLTADANVSLGTGSVPSDASGTILAESNYIIITDVTKLNKLTLTIRECVTPITIELWVRTFDIADGISTRGGETNSQTLIQQSFTTGGTSQGFFKNNFTIAAHTLTAKTGMQIAYRTTSGTNTLQGFNLIWDFE